MVSGGKGHDGGDGETALGGVMEVGNVREDNEVGFFGLDG